MPRSAMPLDLQQKHDNSNTDMDNAIQRKWDKGWFSFGPNAKETWTWLRLPVPFTALGIPLIPFPARFRAVPRLLWAKGGLYRWLTRNDADVVELLKTNEMTFVFENKTRFSIMPVIYIGIDRASGEMLFQDCNKKTVSPVCFSTEEFAPSSIQYWSKWGVVLLWPFHFFAWYTVRPQKDGQPGTEKVLYFRIGARWASGQDMYDFPSAALGTHWT